MLSELEKARGDFQRQLKRLQEEQAAQMAQLQKVFAEQQAKALQESQNALRFQELTVAFERRASVTVDQLPSIMVPTEEAALDKLAGMHHLLTQWAASEPPTPFTFADLVAHTPLAQEAPTFVKAALGDKWLQWFAESPSPETVLPRQVAMLLRDSLQRMSDNWEGNENKDRIAAQAAGSFAALSGAAKKRRAVLLDCEMVPILGNA